MSKFMVDLDEAHREKLEAHRVRLGLRSHAETVRALIDGPKMTEAGAAQAVRTVPPMHEQLSAAQAITFGPAKASPGSRLKKPKG